MALFLRPVTRIIQKNLITDLVLNTYYQQLNYLSTVSRPLYFRSNVLAVVSLDICNQKRSTSFFNKLPAEHLWKGVTSVSNAGKKRGRGRASGRKIAKNLNKGQIIGVGQVNMVWPGLNAPVVRGKELIQQQKLPEDPERMEKLIKIRDQMGSFKRLRLLPIDRGWSGTKMPGRSIGPPDPVNDETFEGFDTKVLEMKSVMQMSGNFGRKRRVSALVVTGNKNGTAGFALIKSVENQSALKQAKNRAGKKLLHFELYNQHTINHDFFMQFGKTKLFVFKKPEGFGLVCHRAIRTMCEVIGIKDLYAKVEGSTKNVQHITKAFFIGLLQQKTHQQMADEKRLHLVEFRKENAYYPTVVASPSKCRTAKEVEKNEILDFTQNAFNGRVVLRKKKNPPFYANYKSYEIYQRRTEQRRNLDKVYLKALVEYGEIRSFLTDKYPEARVPKPDFCPLIPFDEALKK